MVQRNWTSIQEGYARVRDRVQEACDRVHRDGRGVNIVTVTKTVLLSHLVEAYNAGVRMFGENYVQEALPKMDGFSQQIQDPTIQWHFVGALQSKKAKHVVGRFALIHSLDRWSLIEALEKSRQATGLRVKGLLEINIAGEENKAGISIQEVREFVERVSGETNIEVMGLMAFPPLVRNPEDSRPYFVRVRKLAYEIMSWNVPRVSMEQLSMGVTNDFEVAVEEGATLVRIGTAIFGPRGKG